MKKILTLFIAISFISCNDGDFDIPNFQFNNTIYSCDNYVLYVTNNSKTETLVITLTNNELGTDIGTVSYPVNSSRKAVYRLFKSAIDNNYFCQTIPPITPSVISELDAISATINITTSEVKDKDNVLTGYSYDISFSDLLFKDSDGRIFYESFPFGSFEIDLEDL
ncbi:hypothetical protein [Lutibacter sp. HS1-25]|uniref:hypothetical protein n=1 Tax=Lutibacter sp. HS1-25 TaxID=2485000 RepID=UPI00101068F1|nr:hypothetical protein [Lutibacter sp. HS1-25]